MDITNKTTKLRRFANGLTLFRLFAAIPLLIALSTEFLGLAWLIICISGASDIADGYLARRAGGGSTWGARFDPLADKLFLIAPLLWLLSKDILPVWSIWVVVSRELIITYWRSSKAHGGPAGLLGKLKTILQFISILLMLWPANWGDIYLSILLNKIGWYLFWPSLLLSINSGFVYLIYQEEHRQN